MNAAILGGLFRAWPGVVLLVPLAAPLPVLAESIYYQSGKDGSIRLTNAPKDPGYHTYLTTGRWPTASDGSVAGLYAGPIGLAASRFGVDPNLVRAVIATESNFDPGAVSPKGARGLMQLMPSTAARFGVQDIFDPMQNIQGGVRYLRYLLDHFGGDLVLALAAYNAGENVVQDRGRVPNYRETREYVDRVLALYGREGGRGRDPGKMGSGDRPNSMPPRKTPIYRSVSSDGVLVFSDSPVRKTLHD